MKEGSSMVRGIYAGCLALLCIVSRAAVGQDVPAAANHPIVIVDTLNRAGARIPTHWAGTRPGWAGLLEQLHLSGFYFAEVASRQGEIALVLGPRLRVSQVTTRGLTAGRPAGVLESLVGRYLTPGLVDSVAFAALATYEVEGIIGTQLRVDSVGLSGEGLDLQFQVQEGARPTLLGLLVTGTTRASDRYLQRLLGLTPGMQVESFRADRLAAQLRESGLFQRIDPPLLVPTGDTTAVVQLVLEDRAPGSFDLALGYLPPAAGRSGTVVGSGQLLLRNLFGGGRTISMDLDRLPEQASRLNARIDDPFVFGPRVGGNLAFEGYSQDSTYNQQRYGLGVVLDLGPTRLTARFSREVVRPGNAGLVIEDGVQQVPDSRSRFAGFGLAYRSVDDPITPTRGLVADVEVLRGRKVRSGIEALDGLETRVERGTSQDRIRGRARWYRPLSKSVVLVSGLDVAAVMSDVVDPSDLFRLGGASSLRGYDEDRFQGEAVARGLTELRRLLQGPSFTFVFFDLGFVDAPEPRTGDSNASWYPGFGLGARVETGAGLLNVSYAVNTEEGPRNGRVHIGIAFGL